MEPWTHQHTCTAAPFPRSVLCFDRARPHRCEPLLRKHTGHGRMRTTMRETTQIWQQAILRPHPPIPPALRTIEPSSCKSCTWSVQSLRPCAQDLPDMPSASSLEASGVIKTHWRNLAESRHWTEGRSCSKRSEADKVHQQGPHLPLLYCTAQKVRDDLSFVTGQSQ